MTRSLLLAPLLFLLLAATGAAQTPTSGKRVHRLLIHNATVVDGNGTPASGPKDILVENNTIADVVALDPVALGRGGGRRGPAPDAVIDATGKYVLPGLIDAHAHLQEERGGQPQPIEYELDIWLACGITTVRDVGSDTQPRPGTAPAERRRPDRRSAHLRLPHVRAASRRRRQAARAFAS